MDRLQKILSSAGVASRRTAETLIQQGRVSVNGQTVTALGTKADPAMDEIRVDGRRIKPAGRMRYILLNKPRGYVSTRSDPQKRKTVLDLLSGVNEYIYPVGRLDYDSEGVLLLTNDGELTALLTHPRHALERVYRAQVAGVPDERALDRLRRGVPLDGHRTAPAVVTVLGDARRGGTPVAPPGRESSTTVEILIKEGRNRQVRRMCEAVGHPVQRLTRIRFGPLTTGGLRPGTSRELRASEVAALRQAAQPNKDRAGEGRREPATSGSGRQENK